MSKREELEVRLRDAERFREQYDAEARLIQEQLDALPKERVRLRAEKCGLGSLIYAGNATAHGFVVEVFGHDCARHGIDPAALAAHICRFGEPDVTREMEALEAAVRAWRYDDRSLVQQAPVIANALAALDAARKGGA